MPTEFDPIGSRSYWLDLRLKWPFDPGPTAKGLHQAGYYWLNLNGLVELYLLGLVDRARPILEEWIDRMEAIPESDPLPFEPTVGGYSQAGSNLVYQWQGALGLCKWLSRGDAAFSHFHRALEADWYCWTLLSPADMAEHRVSLEYLLPLYVAMALAGENPARGLNYLALVDLKEQSEDNLPILEFGEWACRHLAGGGGRTAEFIARGTEMLRSVPSDYFTSEKMSEVVLWLKAIYWDSGVVQTPEQAILKAYDFMPGVQRPDFVPT